MASWFRRLSPKPVEAQTTGAGGQQARVGQDFASVNGDGDAAETPNTQVVIHDFGGKTFVTETRGLKTDRFQPKSDRGWVIYGTTGIIAGTSLFDLEGKLVRTFTGQNENHFANFLKAVRSRKVSELNADILEGHQSTALCHIGNISYRLGHPTSLAEIESRLGSLKVHEHVVDTFERTRKHLGENGVDLERSKLTLGPLLQLIPDQEKFLDQPGADAFLTRQYRKPFVVPAQSEI